MTASNPSRRRVVSASLFVVIVAAHAVFWRSGADRMRDEIDAWIAGQRAAGVDVSHGAVAIGGYPFLWRASVADVEIADPASASWRADRLNVVYNLAAPQSIALVPRGDQRVALADGTQIDATATAARLDIGGAPGGGWQMSLQARGSVVSVAETRGDVGALMLDIAPHRDDPTVLAIRMTMNDAVITGSTSAAMIEQVLASVDISAAAALSSPSAWRAAGGAVAIAVEAAAEDAAGSLRGSVSLDASGFPQGVLQTDVERPGGLARVLSAAGALTEEDARLAEAGLTLAAFAQGGRVKGPITLEDGQAAFAGAPLGALPQIIP
ncbi:MAG: DUF2125 domain-containing protein [Pseudomonadota bacterium]